MTAAQTVDAFPYWRLSRRAGPPGDREIDARPFRVLVATDAWRPQVNGVVRTLEALAGEAPWHGAELRFLTPQGFRTLPMPSYPEIRLAMATPASVARAIEAARPNAIHVATEGPIGAMTRRYCLRHRLPFTTCYHTRYPEYLAARAPIPLSAAYAVLRRFHNAAAATMVATDTLRQELAGRGFDRLVRWRRGIDVDAFTGGRSDALEGLARPIFLCVARVAVEKNIEAFLKLDLPGTKVVVGDGPARAELAARYPRARFLGFLSGAALADAYASADAFVFPSLTDTFGLVVLEALAAGLPVAAYPVAGPRDILAGSGCGALDKDLAAAAMAALAIPRSRCRNFAAGHSLADSVRSFLDNVRAAQGAAALPAG
ncbi:glycosyltransferase family 1 protein [Alsobacter sp. SYSU M60028]|uniref:Glycosyltransferase family 1 protein n=1 Tax=Alsobacter ponti TaxID=2962936 RepID=A0ABT1L8U4_9HYPH|nr:glycosyltransferase family 1 protein [Alsobacter ponti]MCP8937371.1 glycosyltransferase family 1 protein [Alsobacter ponti]